MRLRFLTMRERLEEEPEPDEDPDEEPEAASSASTLVPTVADGGREFEYRTELITASQVVDGKSLADQLTRASTDGWDLVDIVSAGERHAIVLRRAKRPERASRTVGFTPPPP